MNYQLANALSCLGEAIKKKGNYSDADFKQSDIDSFTLTASAPDEQNNTITNIAAEKNAVVAIITRWLNTAIIHNKTQAVKECEAVLAFINKLCK